MAGSVSPQAEILYEKAKDAFSRQNYDYAITLLFSALDIADNYSQARNLLYTTALKRYEETMSIITKIFLLIPNGYSLLNSIVLMKKEQWIEAINLLEKSVVLCPPMLLYTIG